MVGAWLGYLDELLCRLFRIFRATTFIHKQHRHNDVVCLNINRIRIQFTRSHFTLLEGRERCQVHPPSTWGLAPTPAPAAPATAHSPLIIGFYLSIYLVGTGKHQNIIEIPKYLNHKGSSWFYFIFLPSSSIATFVIFKLTWQQFGPDTAWIFLKIFCQFMTLVFHPLSSLGMVQKWRFFINACSITCRNFDIFRSVFNFMRGSARINLIRLLIADFTRPLRFLFIFTLCFFGGFHDLLKVGG